MDEKTRQLERQWRALDSEENRTALFVALQRAGQLNLEWYRQLKEKPTYNLTDDEFCNQLESEMHYYSAESWLRDIVTDKIKVLSTYSTGDYQGMVFGVLEIHGDLGFPTYAIWSDYYGSCSGCDSLQAYTKISEVQEHMEGTLLNVLQFWTMEDLATFIKGPKDAGEYAWREFPGEMVEAAMRETADRFNS